MAAVLVAYIGVGAVAGILAGLLGIGGGLIIVPVLAFGLNWQGIPHEHLMHIALGTSMASIAFTSVSSFRAHHKRGAVHWDVVRRITPGILIGTFVGSYVASHMSTAFLKVFFVIFIFYVAIQMLTNHRPKASRHLPGQVGMFGVGNTIGAFSSLVGIGGGTLSVPFMMLCNIEVHEAIGTSAAIGFPIAIAGTAGYLLHGWNMAALPDYSVGFIYLPALCGIVVASVLTAPLGARLAHYLPIPRLKQVFALLLMIVGTRMLLDLKLYTGVFSDHIMLSRLQFAVTAAFHILWPVLTIGLSIFLAIIEGMWLKTGDEVYYRHFKFWGKLFFLTFAFGVVSGIPLEFQFGTNWGQISTAGGDVFGRMVSFEGTMAFTLEATFFGIMMFGMNRVSPRMHFFSTLMVALGSSLSAFWIMVANSWMQTPSGGSLVDGRFVVSSFRDVMFNPAMVWGVLHMWVSALVVSLFVLGGVSAWYIRKGREAAFFSKTFKMALLAAVILMPLQLYLGDGSGIVVYERQPAKLAGMEAHWQTNSPGTGASWKVLAWPDEQKQENSWELSIPYGLSLAATRSLTGRVKGLLDFPKAERPPVLIPFYALRIMILIGVLLFLLTLRTAWVWYKGKLSPDRITAQRGLLLSWMIAGPLSMIAMEAGWMTREIGRQPWLFYGLLRTDEAASPVPAGAVGTSFGFFLVVYAVLLVLSILLAARVISNGPDQVISPPAAKSGEEASHGKIA